MINSLAKKIWGNKEFQTDFNILLKRMLVEEIGIKDSIKDTEILSDDQIRKLLQSASIFADSNDIQIRLTAYQIATNIYALYKSTLPGIYNILYAILSKLGNFPAIKYFNNSDDIPEGFPLSLAYITTAHKVTNKLNLFKDDEITLTDYQKLLWEEMNSGVSLAINAPTSAGKSFIVQKYLLSKLLGNDLYNIIYLVPTRALIGQVQKSLQKALTDNGLKNSITISTIPTLPETSNKNKFIFVLTQERLHILMQQNPDLSFDLGIVDEAHLIEDGSRGIKLQKVIEEMLTRNPKIQLIFASPNLANPNIFKTIFELMSFNVPNKPEPTVSQNIILIDIDPFSPNILNLKCYMNGSLIELGEIELKTNLQDDNSRLAGISYALAKMSQSIVYAGGKAKCENIAKYLMQCTTEDDENKAAERGELSGLIKKHIHNDYILAECVLKGIGFHYGTMPAIVRHLIEKAFEEGTLKFLICTSTLLHGINLPAKNMFMLKPTKGRNIYEKGAERELFISSYDFWNLAGRAGRLGKEFSGNIFLIDYKNWKLQILNEDKEKVITSSVYLTISDRTEELIKYIDSTDHSRADSLEIESTFMKLLDDSYKNILEQTLDKIPSLNNQADKDKIKAGLEKVKQEISVPLHILRENNDISAYKQQRLYTYMLKKVSNKQLEELIPYHPMQDWEPVHKRLEDIFRRIHLFLEKTNTGRWKYYAPLSLNWMRGRPLPQIISEAFELKKIQLKRRKPNINNVVRKVLEDVENVIRFKYVRYMTCYMSMLTYVLRETKNEKYIEKLPSLSLYLEMGAASKTMISFMGMGISRLAAAELNNAAIDKNMNEEQAKTWLKTNNLESLGIKEFVIKELSLYSI